MSVQSDLEGLVARLLTAMLQMGRLMPMRDPLAEFSDLDLSGAQVHTLVRLGDEGVLTMGELASRLGLTQPACTRLVDRMKERGLLLRERDRTDRRVVRVRLSAQGARLWEHICETMPEKMGAFLSLLSESDRTELVAIIERLNAALVRQAAGPTSAAVESTS